MKRRFKFKTNLGTREGRAPLFLLWFLGVPLPVIGIIFLLQGCHTS